MNRTGETIFETVIEAHLLENGYVGFARRRSSDRHLGI